MDKEYSILMIDAFQWIYLNDLVLQKDFQKHKLISDKVLIEFSAKIKLVNRLIPSNF